MARRKKRARKGGKQLVEVYEDLEKIYARKGDKSLWPRQNFVHKFSKGAKVYGVRKGGSVKLKKGDLVVRSQKGKHLWKYFDY